MAEQTPTTPPVPGGKKRKRDFTVGELLDTLEEEPKDYELAWKKLQGRVAEMRGGIARKVPSLAPSSLTTDEAIAIFNLNVRKDVLWDDVEMRLVPDFLTESIRQIKDVVPSLHQSNEAFARVLIDHIILCVVYDQKHDPLEARSVSDAQGPAVLSLRYEVPMSLKVMHNYSEVVLNGLADYSIWYDPKKSSNLGTNLILVEAKKVGGVDSCLGQLTAYMGIVHRTRKNEGRDNSVVYGVAADGYDFRFLRIDDEGGWSKSSLLEWDWGKDAMIYSIFRSLIRIAALSSPSTSPIKDKNRKGRILASFGSSESRKFDYGLSQLNILEQDEETVLFGSGSAD